MVVISNPALFRRLPTSASWTNGETCGANPCVREFKVQTVGTIQTGTNVIGIHREGYRTS